MRYFGMLGDIRCQIDDKVFDEVKLFANVQNCNFA